MARPKEFDQDAVLNRAVELFRQRGFRGASFGEITEALGVGRQSLYDTFGDKDALFHAALKRYRERGIADMRRILEAPGTLRDTLIRVFDAAISAHCEGKGYGCLMANSMVEMSKEDAATRAAAIEHARAVEGLLAARLGRAQREGDLAPEKDPVALARYFHHTLVGLSVAARAFENSDVLRASARFSLSALD